MANIDQSGVQLGAVKRSGALDFPRRVGRGLIWFARKKPLGFIGAAIILIMLVFAAVPDVFAPHPPLQFVAQQLEPPQKKFPFGTDEIGRDYLSRTIWGARISITIGISSVFVGTTVALILGMLSAYLGGIFDLLLQRVIDAMMALPGLVLALFMVTLLPRGVPTLVLAISIIIIPGTTRTIRSQVLAVKQFQYVDGARAVGASSFRIMWRHIFPNITAIYIVLISLAIGSAIITESSLSFLGLGNPSEMPSWGTMVNRGTRNMFLTGPWLALAPSIALALAVYGFNMLGDALRDVLDPRMRGSRGR